MANLFNSVLIASFWGGGLALLCLFFNKVFKKSLPLNWHYYIWLIVLIRLLFPTFITLNILPNEKLAVNAAQNVVGTEELNAYVSTAAYKEDVLPIEDLAQAVGQANSTFNTSFILNKLCIAWLAITVLLILVKLFSQLCYSKNLLKQKLSLSERELSIFEERKTTLNIRRKIIAIKSGTAYSPFALGCLKPMIVLPCKEFTDSQLSHVFDHELSHIARNDIALKWLMEIVKAIHWFNPFVYIASKRLAFYCEISCDEAVLKNSSLEERKNYGLTMIEIISQTAKPKTSLCLSMSSNKADLQKRIKNILEYKQAKKSITLTIAISLLAFALCACSAINLKESNKTAEALPEDIITKTNVLIVGIDANSRTDVLMVASFDSEANLLSLMSIPRDTHLTPSSETTTALSEKGIELPKELKFSQLLPHSNGDIQYLQDEIKNSFDISTDYYIKMDMSAFEKIVDSVGGISMLIPNEGLYYSDPAQNLEISLEEGQQLLDGKKALMLMRYRKSYPNADFDRITIQQEFAKKLLSKIVNDDKALQDIVTLASILIENTETNLTVSDLMAYSLFVPEMTTSSINTLTLPTYEKIIDQRLYAILDEAKYSPTIYNIFAK